MKKIAGLLLTITLLSCASTDGILFKVQYKPETKYNEIIEQSSERTIKYNGDDALLERLEDKGIKNPTITNTSSKIVAEFKTGKLSDGIHFPVNMEVISTTSSDGKKAIPDGTILYGKSKVDSMPVIDSIHAPGMDEDVKKIFMKTVGNLFTQISFPNKKLNVGDTFTHTIPISMPIAGNTIDMVISTTYKLISIENGSANFDISQAYTFKTTEYMSEGSGSGKGQLKYDIAHNFYNYYQEIIEMKLKIIQQGFTMDLSTKSTFTQNVSFSPN